MVRILAYPAFREPLIASGALPYCAELLSLQLEAFCEDAHCASWIRGIEFELWRQMQGNAPTSEPTAFQLSREQCDTFRHLADVIGGWVTRLADDEYLYLPDIAWRQFIRDTQPDVYVEHLRRASADRLAATLDAIRTPNDNALDLSDEEVSHLVDEARDDIEAENAAGTYVPPKETERMTTAMKAYHAWRETGQLPAQP